MNRDKWRSNRIIRTIIFRCRSFMEKRSFSRGRNNKILNLQPIEADGYKKLLITMSEKTDSCENLL